MAINEGHETSFLESKLLRAARKFTFEKAVDLMHGKASNHSFIGKDDAVENEAILFRANPSLGFPSSDLDRARMLENGKVELVVNFMGLYGPSSPLPNYFSDAILEEAADIERGELNSLFIDSEAQLWSVINQTSPVDNRTLSAEEVRNKVNAGTVKLKVVTDRQMQSLRHDVALEEVVSNQELLQLKSGKLIIEIQESPKSNQRDFLDLFNHRLISLFYLAIKKYHPESDLAPVKRQRHLNMLLSLIGAPPEDLRKESKLNWHKLLRFSGLLGMKNGNPEVICKVISGYFKLPLEQVSITEGIERLVAIPEVQRWHLGARNSTVGKNIVLGDFIPDFQGKFRINITELDVTTFVRFLPYPQENKETKMGDLHDALIELCEFLRSPEQSFDVCLKLNQNETVPFTLAENSINRLGWSCWLAGCLPDNNQAIIN